jgi:hypothetical protein
MWLTDKRLKVFNPAWSLARRLLGWRASIAAGRLLERVVTRRLIPDEDQRRAAHLAYCLARKASAAGATSPKVNATGTPTRPSPVLDAGAPPALARPEGAIR